MKQDVRTGLPRTMSHAWVETISILFNIFACLMVEEKTLHFGLSSILCRLFGCDGQRKNSALGLVIPLADIDWAMLPQGDVTLLRKWILHKRTKVTLTTSLKFYIQKMLWNQPLTLLKHLRNWQILESIYYAGIYNPNKAFKPHTNTLRWFCKRDRSNTCTICQN